MSSYVVMGVSGCGKSSVAQELAARTGGLFLDADDFHPLENKAKMAASIPLTDEDRVDWLRELNAELRGRGSSPQNVFLACSALRQAYRDRLAEGLPNLCFIYLKGTKELIRRRLEERKDHFMSPALLDSQFALLEEPREAITVGIEDALFSIVEKVLAQIQEAAFPPASP